MEAEGRYTLCAAIPDVSRKTSWVKIRVLIVRRLSNGAAVWLFSSQEPTRKGWFLLHFDNCIVGNTVFSKIQFNARGPAMDGL